MCFTWCMVLLLPLPAYLPTPTFHPTTHTHSHHYVVISGIAALGPPQWKELVKLEQPPYSQGCVLRHSSLPHRQLPHHTCQPVPT